MSEIQSLIKLLDDPDNEVYAAIEKELFKQGISVIKDLEQTWENSDNKLVQKRIEILTHEINFNYVSTNLKNWFNNDKQGLFDTLMLISKFQYPDINFDVYKEKFNQIIEQLKGELNENLTPLEKVKVINHIIYQVNQFSISVTAYNSPQSYFISSLFDNKKGNFLSLCLFYMSVCQELDIPVHGLELPDNLVLAYTKFDDNHTISDRDVLFYINPSNKGAVFSRLEIDSFLGKMHVEKNDVFYKPVVNSFVVVAMLKSLMMAYERLGYKEKKSEIKKLLKATVPDLI